MDKNRNVVHNSSTDNKGRYMIVWTDESSDTV